MVLPAMAEDCRELQLSEFQENLVEVITSLGLSSPRLESMGQQDAWSSSHLTGHPHLSAVLSKPMHNDFELLQQDHCVVCGDKATKGHYKGPACASCRCFFGNQILKGSGKSQFCKNSTNDCKITKSNRQTCPACRLKQCYQAGMAPRDINTHLGILRREIEFLPQEKVQFISSLVQTQINELIPFLNLLQSMCSKKE